MSSTAAISQWKLTSDGVSVRFRLSWDSRSSVLYHLSIRRSYLIIWLHWQFVYSFFCHLLIWVLLQKVKSSEFQGTKPCHSTAACSSVSHVSVQGMVWMLMELYVWLHILGDSCNIWGNTIFDCGGKSNQSGEVRYSSFIWRTLTPFSSKTL